MLKRKESLDYLNFYKKVCTSKSYSKDKDFVTRVSSNDIFPLNRYLKYVEPWIVVPVVDFQVCLHFYNESNPLFLERLNSLISSYKRLGLLTSSLEVIHPYYQPFYRLNPGWKSGMAQGLLTSLLIRAYWQTNDFSYKEKALLSLENTLKPLSQGGVFNDNKTRLWFEEYPRGTDFSRQSSVLNGHLFSLFSIIDMESEKPDLIDLKNELMDALFKQLSIYSRAESLSFYDREERMSSLEYHELHISQLDYLYEYTGDKRFEKYSAIFRSKPTDRKNIPVKTRISLIHRKVVNLYFLLKYKTFGRI